MSLNDYFAANGAVYLRPMGLPDCFNMPGLPHGLKPPAMPLQPQQKPRSMAAVSPLHQGLPPPPPNMGGSYENSYGAGQPANRTSSFAAALRKLAKQAVDPVAGDKDPTQISPVSSPSLGVQGGPQKRTAPANSAPPPPMFLTSHQGAYGGSSPPPVVTIAPSRPVATHTSDSRKVVDLSNVPPTNNPNPISNGHMQEPLKMDSSKGIPRHSEKWEESNLSTKGLSVSSASSQVRPHATIAPLPRPDDSVTSSRGFQPYRGAGAEESRNTLPHHPLSMFEHHHPSYPYAPAAFLPPPHHLSHPAYRFDDPLYLERYSLLRPPMLPYGQPSMMGPPAAAFYPNSRYAADLIAQSLSISNNSMLNHERLKAEEQERRIREKEQELKEQERQRDRDHREKERRHSKDEHYEHRKSSSSYSSSSKRTESPNVRTTPVIHSTPNHAPPVVSSSSSIPLNLVLQSGEPQRKETTELWMPWQQPANTHAKDANQDMGNSGAKHPAFRTQDGHRHHQARENHTNDKPPNLRFSPSSSMEKKQPIPTATDQLPTTIDKKHPDLNHLHRTSDSTRSQQDTQRTEYRTQQDTPRTDYRLQDTTTNNNRTSYEASKDTTPHEWRHEKLQKACTNIHRKSHESKRANSQKDGIYQNHHNRNKTVNGTVLKPTLYQNEGMHARLLESEKCRLEMNGHVLKSPGLVVPSPYKPYPQQQKDPSQKSFSDYFGPSSVLLKSSVVELPPVVSKLDIELRRLRKGEKLCVDEEKEEKRMRNLLVIAKMPHLKFDSNPHKLNFLRLFGLTTHHKKKKVEFDMFLKRRKRLRQDSSLTPPNLLKNERRDEDEDEDLIPEKRTPMEVDRLAERLRTEDTTTEKTDFLSMFRLKPFTLELREEKDRLRRKVSEEKCRRHYRLLATVNRKSSPKRLFVPKSEAAQRLDHLKKLSEMNAVPNGLISKRMDEDEETTEVKPSSGQTVAPKLEQVPYTLSAESNPLSAHKSLTKYSFKRGHSLKREFRFATPHPNCKSIRGGVTNGVSSSAVRRSVGTQADAAADKCAAELKSSLGLSATIETLMEVIYRSQTEQSGEKTVLGERCQQLRQTQEDLKKQADALSRQMSDLLRSKRELDEERQSHQKSIDHLKKCLQLGR